ncbi:MAG: flagellar motor protein [Gammaproteobacteria bacterium]|nr:flagellar motor protein [Gammaproteobacteria bacterium]NND39457.1 flagellar motor protein [Pseudomonadales bacterium]NNM11927.1 flagellar motor protein [Pseudomonadales bacterium]RZV52863.1 MAG: flagellar motor protein [Pseudomonadales bacterium]
MDFLSVLGVVIAFAAILGGNFLEGGQLETLLNGPAALIVIGGTIGAAVLQTPRDVFVRALGISSWVFRPPASNFDQQLKSIVHWASIARRDGLLGLEKIVSKEPGNFARKGLQLLADGAEPSRIRMVMEVDQYNREREDLEAAAVYEAMGGYAPTIGIIGAVLGLIHVMGNLADPSMLGTGIAIAFVATIYGVGLANLLLLPVASKLRAYARQQARVREMLVEGLLSIAEGENPRAISEKLKGFYRAA